MIFLSFLSFSCCSWFLRLASSIRSFSSLALCLRTNSNSPLAMTVMDGITMIREIKQDRTISHIPIIILSAKASVEDQLKAVSEKHTSWMPLFKGYWKPGKWMYLQYNYFCDVEYPNLDQLSTVRWQVNDRMCRELGLYYDSNYNLVIKKDNSK